MNVEGVGHGWPPRRVRRAPARTRFFAIIAALCAALLLSGCAGNPPESTVTTDPLLLSDSSLPSVTESAAVPTAPDGTINLRAAGCPDPIVIASDGPPSLYESALFELSGGTRPSAQGRYLDDLLDPATGKTTGTQLELRFATAAGASDLGARLAEPKVFGALASTEEQILAAVSIPTVAVAAPWAQLARMLYWDPATYPQTQAIPDLGGQDIRVSVRERAPWVTYLINNNLLTEKIVVVAGPGVDLVAAFLADHAKSAAEGSAMIDPPAVNRGLGHAIRFQLVANAGYDPYPASLVVRRSSLKDQAPCLRALVPLLQTAQVHFSANPQKAAALIARVAREQGVSPAASVEVLVAQARRALALGLIANSDNGMLGSIDAAKMRRMLKILTPIAKQRRTPIAVSLKAEQLFDNQFINRLVALPQP